MLVTGTSEEQLLQTEETLKPVLDSLVEAKTIRSYNAISDWVPSVKQQSENRKLIAEAEKSVLRGISVSLGEELEEAALQ